MFMDLMYKKQLIYHPIYVLSRFVNSEAFVILKRKIPVIQNLYW
jgi:hypothetical protein